MTGDVEHDRSARATASTASATWARVLVIVAATAVAATAQTPSDTSFEAASVKPRREVDATPRIAMPVDRFEANAVPLRGLIALAYGDAGPPPQTRSTDLIAGGPAWIDNDLFDIVAKMPASAPAGPAGVGAKLSALRQLLEERFKLVVHHEDRDTAAYALVLARRDGRLGAGLRSTDTNCRVLLMARGAAPPPPRAPGDRPLCSASISLAGVLTAGALTMPLLANTLSRAMNHIIVDRTGLAGAFDIDLRFNPDMADGMNPPGPARPAAPDDAPSVFTALQEQLGLRLESTRSAVDVLVVDRAEHPDPD